MSTDTDEVIAIEKGFWTRSNDAAYFAEHIADGAITVIEPLGLIEKTFAVESTKQGHPFTEVEFRDTIVREVVPGVIVLAYHGQGRTGDHLYQGAICSVYVKRDGRWRSVASSHQPWKPKA
ncbi:MAG TPA: hypothetical protein VKR80_07915 [Candidatus Limnocylindria bacterium]|nr:hypothetical protein [Candidatus Limnocylindria bacterium]